ncbi:MAG: hypothetical protein K2Q03_06285 [Sphingobacteriaceae bacterium]|nr:hypothetical protein [Sphingobacteriaceae bacterium]
MNEQLINNAQALRMFFDDDIYTAAEKTTDTKATIAPQVALEPAIKTSTAEVEKPKEVLISTPEKEVKNEINFVFKGKNERKILILVNDDLNEVSDEMGTELLRKLLLAIKLGGKDFALLNYAKYHQTDYQTLLDFFKSEIVLSFGVSPKTLSMDDKPQHTLVIEKNVKLIFTSNLSALANQPQEKAMLWASLKALNL